MKVLRRETFKSAVTMGSIKGRFTWLMWTTRGHLIINAGEAAKQQLRCRPAGASSSLIIISPFSEVLCLHSNWNSNECAQVQPSLPVCPKKDLGEKCRRRLERPLQSAPARRPDDGLRSGGSSKALEKLRWKRDRIIVWPSLENQRTIQFCFCLPLSLFFSTDPCRDLCTLFSLSHCLLFILWHGLSQKVFFCFFLVNLGQDARVKYAEDGIIGLEAEAG